VVRALRGCALAAVGGGGARAGPAPSGHGRGTVPGTSVPGKKPWTSPPKPWTTAPAPVSFGPIAPPVPAESQGLSPVNRPSSAAKGAVQSPTRPGLTLHG